MKRLIVVLMGIAALAMQGCGYLGDRVGDAADVMDLGVTVSTRAQFAAYGCALGLAGAGYGELDGHVAGLFGGRVGVQSLEGRIWGAGPISGETIKVGDAEPIKRCSGALCIVTRAPEGTEKAVSCCHYLHLGYIGLAGNLHYKEVLDLAAGFVGWDVCRDDAYAIAARRAAAEAEEARLAAEDLSDDMPPGQVLLAAPQAHAGPAAAAN
jgi:hypothetical protein